jgi:phage gp16-like protein
MPPSKISLAKIHVAKKELGLTDDAYRDILRVHFQVASSKDLTDRQATVLLNQFRAKGWTAKRGKNQAAPAERKGYIEIKPGPAAKQQRKILALWNSLGYEMAKLHTRVKTQFGVERFEWLEDPHSLHVLITDLEYRAKKLTGTKRKGGQHDRLDPFTT